MQDSRMLGYWSPRCPVRTSHPMVLATCYQKEGRTLIAVASWAAAPEAVDLLIDWDALGLDPTNARLSAPAVENFQPGSVFDPAEPLLVEPGKGWLLVLEAIQQN
jgi:hypothetical protein